MKYMMIASVVLLTGCSHMANDSWSGQDKAQHFLGSAMLSAAGNEVAQHQGYSRDRSAMVGLMFSISLGASKELLGQPSGGEWLELERFRMGCCRCHNGLYRVATGKSLKTDAFPFTMKHKRNQKC